MPLERFLFFFVITDVMFYVDVFRHHVRLRTCNMFVMIGRRQKFCFETS